MEYLESIINTIINTILILLKLLFDVVTNIWNFSCNTIGEPLTIVIGVLGTILILAVIWTLCVNLTQGSIENTSANTMKFFLLAIGVFAVFFFLYLINFFEI